MPYIPNLLSNEKVLEAAGINFGEGEMYNISLSIHDFAIEQAKKENNFKRRKPNMVLSINLKMDIVWLI